MLQDPPGSQPGFDLFMHRIILPAGQVGRLAQHSGLEIDNPRYADTNAQQLASGTMLAGQIGDRRAHLVDYPITAEDLGAGAYRLHRSCSRIGPGNTQIGYDPVQTAHEKPDGLSA